MGGICTHPPFSAANFTPICGVQTCGGEDGRIRVPWVSQVFDGCFGSFVRLRAWRRHNHVQSLGVHQSRMRIYDSNWQRGCELRKNNGGRTAAASPRKAKFYDLTGGQIEKSGELLTGKWVHWGKARGPGQNFSMCTMLFTIPAEKNGKITGDGNSLAKKNCCQLSG